MKKKRAATILSEIYTSDTENIFRKYMWQHQFALDPYKEDELGTRIRIDGNQDKEINTLIACAKNQNQKKNIMFLFKFISTTKMLYNP